MLLSLEFSKCLCFQFRSSRYITRLKRTSELKVIVVCICYELPFPILSVSIYYGTKSDIRVKSYCSWNLLRALVSITSVSIYYRTQSDIRVKSYCSLNLLQASIFNFKRLDILRDTIDIREKSYCRLNLLRPSVFNFERFDILRDSI